MTALRITGASSRGGLAVYVEMLPQDAQLCYMVLKPPLVGSLDYTIRVHEELLKGPDGGTIYHSRWELANFDGPPPRAGVTRVTINEGSWLLEPIGNQTRATYTLYTDGGGIPALLLNFANITFRAV